MKSGAERQKEYRERKKAGQTGDWQVKALKEEFRMLGDLVGALEARIEVLEARSARTLEGMVDRATPNNALAQLRAQIAAVPSARTFLPPRTVSDTNPAGMPVRPYGEWEPS